jgi:hypothetical protein
MNTPVPPTPPSSAILQTVASTTTSTGTIVQPATPKMPFKLGQLLAGTVLNHAAPGQFLVKTESGQLTLQTATNLLIGSVLNLQIQTAGTRPQVLIIPLPGETRTPQIANLSTAPTITSTLTQGSIASATILRPISVHTPQSQGTQGATGVTLGAITPGVTTGVTPGVTPEVTPGVTPGVTPVLGVVGSAQPTPAGRTTSGVSTAAGITPTSASATPTGASLAGTGPLPPILPNGATFNLRIVSVVPAASQTPLTASKAQGALIGTVTGTTPTGQTIVQTPLGEISLSARSTLPHGTQLHLQMLGAPKFPMRTGDTSSLLLSQQWETLKDAMAAIQSSDPAAARNMVQRVLPQAGGPMTTGMLFFLAAIMTGDLRRWMGEEAMRVLQRSGGNLLDRLRQDVGEMQRMANEPSGQEWRSYLIPLLAGVDLQQLKLFIRGEKEPDEDGKQEKNRNIRFVIEVEFSKLGPFQFDGLTRDKTIDLMVRTRDALAKDIRDDIREIFGTAISALGFTGSINFQRAAIFELNPTQEIHASQSRFTV